MKVLHFYKTYFPDTVGGVEQAIYQIACGTAKYGVETEVLTLSDKMVPRTIKIDNHMVYRARSNFQIASTRFSLSSFFQFAKLGRSVDLIHFHYPWPFMDMVHLAVSLNKPTVLTYHSDIVRQKFLLKLYNPLKKKFLDSIDRLVATSPNYLATSKVLNQYRHKTSIIPIGLEKSTYPEPKLELLQYWKSQVGEGYFLFVGVIRYYKGLHILLEAMRGVNYPVVIVGSGPIEKQLKKHAQMLGLTGIKFLGRVSDESKVALIKLCRAVIFPSHLRSEAFGVSLLEGAMFGKPLISSEIGTGTSYINVHNETGIVVPPGDPVAFRRAMFELWQNPLLVARYGANARKRYEALFTADIMAKNYVKIYHELLHTTYSKVNNYDTCHQ